MSRSSLDEWLGSPGYKAVNSVNDLPALVKEMESRLRNLEQLVAQLIPVVEEHARLQNMAAREIAELKANAEQRR